jgi:ABC-type bacteriocin/lantibiotic exporter with double-glycine peptidase domain
MERDLHSWTSSVRLAPDSTTTPDPLPGPAPTLPAFLGAPPSGASSPPLADALLLLAASAGVEISRADVEHQLARASTASRDRRDVVEILTRAGEELGLRMRVLQLPCVDLGGPASTGLFPALAFASGRGVAVRNATPSYVEVVDPGSDEPSRRFSHAALATELGLASTAVPVRWMVADPKRSLDAVRHAGGGDGHGRGGAHATPERRLWELLKLERDDAWVAVVYAAGVGLLSIATPLGVQFLVNTVAFGALVQPLIVLTLMVAAGLVFAGTLRALQTFVVERLQQRLFARVALDLAHRLPRVRVEALDGQHGPELVNRFFDTMTLQKGAATLLVDGVSVVLQTAVGFILLAFYHPYLAAFDALLVVSLVVIVFVLGRGGPSTAIKESKTKYALAAWLQETIRHIHAFKLQGGPEYANARAESLTRDYVTYRRKHFEVVFRQHAAALIVQAIASAVLLGLGGALVIGRQLTLGQLVAAELIVTAVVAGFSKLGKYFETYYDLLAAIDKIGHLVDLPVEASGGMELPDVERGLELRAVGIEIRREEREVLHDVNLVVPAGARVALFGLHGQGKSCLVDVLFGLRAPAGGRIDVDGIDARELAPTSLRRRIALLREPDIFSGTIADNVQLGRAEVTRHDMRCALETLGVWDFVTALPGGLDTHIATRGVGMPSGFVTMLLVARALAGRPRAVVLDGVLDTLDLPAREAVQRAIAALQPRCSILVTTCDASVLAWCGQGYVLEAGTVRPAAPPPPAAPARPASAQEYPR